MNNVCSINGCGQSEYNRDVMRVRDRGDVRARDKKEKNTPTQHH